MSLRRILVGNRRFRVRRVVGGRTAVQILVWSVVVLAGLTVYRTPELLDGPLTVAGVLDAVSVAQVPLVVLGVTGVVVVLNTLRELRYLLFGRRHGRRRSYDSESYDDSEGGGLFESFGGLGDFGGDDGDGGGDGE